MIEVCDLDNYGVTTRIASRDPIVIVQILVMIGVSRRVDYTEQELERKALVQIVPF